MAGTSLRRLVVPWRNRAIALCPPLHRLACRLDFCVRHLPRLVSKGWSAPLPALLKRAFLRGIARDSVATTFVETGTYLGDTTWEFRNDFHHIHSIEVEPHLCALASRRLRNFDHITIHQGDSAAILPALVPTVKGAALYWLDGHYSAGITGTGVSHCPIVGELEAIYRLSRDPFTIVIDDARCFGTDPAYPTIAEVTTQVAALSGGRSTVSVENDMIVIRHQSSGT